MTSKLSKLCSDAGFEACRTEDNTSSHFLIQKNRVTDATFMPRLYTMLRNEKETRSEEDGFSRIRESVQS